MFDATCLPRGYAVRYNIVALYSTVEYKFKFHSTYLPMWLSWERVCTVIRWFLIQTHSVPLFFFQQCSLVGIYVCTSVDPQSE